MNRVLLKAFRGLVLAVVLSLLGVSFVSASGDPFRIGVLVDGPWSGNEGLRDLTIAEVRTLTDGEFEVEFPQESYLVGDWTLETAERLLERLLADPEVDVVVTWGLLASNTVCCYEHLPKPVIAPVVIDQELQGFPLSDGVSGVSNLSYVWLPDTLASDLVYFRRMIPFRQVAILLLGALLDAIPELPARTRQQLGETDMDFEYIPVRDSVDEALAGISPQTDAVYVWPLFHVSAPDYQRLIDRLNERRLPTFSALGGADLEMGMLASLGSEEFLPRLARRVAINLQRLLLGEDAGTIPVEFIMRERLRINMRTARLIDVSPSRHMMVEAEVLNEVPLVGIETRTLRSAVSESVRLNLDIAARLRAVDAGRQDVARSRSVFLPQIDLGTLGRQIDDDRALASLGLESERMLSASATLSQLIFSDPALADANIQQRLQEGRDADLEVLRLDIALGAATAYLNLLRAKSLVQVQRNNVELTRSNLELAQMRRSVGSANPAEVYRWESQIAIDRKELIDALGDQQVVEIELNRLMHRPLGERLLTQEVGVTDPGLLTGHYRFRGYTETARRYEVFTEFLVQDGLAAAPELAEIDAAIAAQQRLLQATKRAYWAPTLGLEATYEEILQRSGAGATIPSGFDLFPLPISDDTNWSVGVRATLPLFRGGARAADRIQADIELERLALARSSVAEKLEQRIRSAMANAWASFPGIELTEEAAGAAGKNLDLVSDAYARGAVSIIDLLDAQNATLNAEEQATNAVYDFLVDLMEAERANAHFQLLMTRQESTAWFDRLDSFFESRGIGADSLDFPSPREE